MDIFNSYQSDFIRKSLFSPDDKKLFKIDINVLSYNPTGDKDKDLILENLPEMKAFANHYLIKKKEF
jgi:hypothetical protein